MSSRDTDWDGIEREFRAGSLSIREIGRRYDISEAAIRKRSKEQGWSRDLSEDVRKAVREKLLRADSAREGAQDRHATDREVVEGASSRGFQVVTSHRRDLEQLHGLKRIIAGRLAVHLAGGEPDGPFIGDKESPGDLLEKLSRVTSRLIPLERQAFNLDEGGEDGAIKIVLSPADAAL